MIFEEGEAGLMKLNKGICKRCRKKKKHWVLVDGIDFWVQYKWGDKWKGAMWERCDIEEMYRGKYYQNVYGDEWAERDRVLIERCPYYLEHVLSESDGKNGTE